MLLPEAILKSGGGNILYKDIFAMYNPLSYQINALLYTIFGISITTLQAAGAVTTFLILLSLYTVARLFINRFYSLTICILISSLYIFAQISCVNYLFPYAYAFIYALLGFMAFIVLTLFYIKYDNKKLILPAALCLGFSIANKYEYILSIIPFLALLIYKKEHFKYFFYSITGFAAPLVVSWGILFLQGFGIEDMRNYLDFIQRFFATEEQQTYNKKINFVWDTKNFKTIIISLISTILYAAFGVLTLKTFRKNKILILGIILVPLFILTTLILIKKNFTEQANPLSWVCLASIIILIFNIKNIKNTTGLMLNTLLLFGICAGARLNFLLIAQGYQIYITPIPLIASWIYLIQTNYKFCEKYKLKQIISYVMLLFSLINFAYPPLYPSP